MLFSEHFKLNHPSERLPFVDIDMLDDKVMFIDPTRLRFAGDDWSMNAANKVRQFFQAVLLSAQNNDSATGLRLLSGLSEPRETRMGYAQNSYYGSGVGNKIGLDVWMALRSSKAASTGLLRDLEDAVLMIEDISSDRVSDMVTNIIREDLSEFTQEICLRFNVAMREFPISVWDAERRTWKSIRVQLPYHRNEKILLVPKRVAGPDLEYSVSEFTTHIILEERKKLELADPRSALVRLVKDEPTVTKKDLRKQYGDGKKEAMAFATERPYLLDEYRKFKEKNMREFNVLRNRSEKL